MRIFMYVLRHDGGFAPNPFHGWCTLACCKPAIRRRARRGDWVVGLTPKAQGNRVAYVMQVDDALNFQQYWSDPRFRQKRPRWRTGRSLVEKSGDNCYQPTGGGSFRQLPSWHWDHVNDREHQGAKARDLGGQFVLVGRRFSYFGEGARPLPPELSSLKLPARYNRVNFDGKETAALLRFVTRLPRGLRGRPRDWSEPADTSWREGRVRCG